MLYIGLLYALDALSGSTLWFVNMTGYDRVAYDGGRLFLGDTQSGIIRAIDTASHTWLWSYNTTGYLGGGISVADGIVYGGGSPNGGSFTALNATNGRPFWSERIGALGPPAIAYGMLFLSWGGGLAAYNRSDGSLVWAHSLNLKAVIGSIPAVADGFAFIGGGSTPVVYAFDAKSGRTAWEFSVEKAALSSPAISKGVVYIGDDAGNLYSIGDSTHNLLVLAGISITAIAILVTALLVFRKTRTRQGHAKDTRVSGSR